MDLDLEQAKVIFTAGSTVVALAAFLIGVVQYVHQNTIRRYEKFQEMSVRFDKTGEIQKVCRLLRGRMAKDEAVDVQDKEVFICFIEEIYFMMRSGIMKEDLALYTFGYYARFVEQKRKEFWHGLDENELFFVRFREFCAKANDYRPPRTLRERSFRKEFAY